MRRAARTFVGTHDFRAFTANRGVPLADAVRTVTCCEVRRRGPLLTFVIAGTGFLYKMCRAMVGTLVQLGQGKLDAADLRRILDSRDRRAAGMTAPATDWCCGRSTIETQWPERNPSDPAPNRHRPFP